LVDNRLDCNPELPDLARVGLELALVEGFETVEYFGQGPYENYRDRSACTWSERFESTVDAMHVPYIMPQENGNRSEVRWCALKQADGPQLRVDALDQVMEFKATHLNDADLFAATHTYELEPRAETWLYLDHMQRGMGTMSCGPDTLEQYKIQPGKYEWSFVLSLQA